ncbi:unnamed protein product [Triticum aestivum]|uniref:Uncharacterized protein n=1 Tax=Triticum aestivum TaxID=4565 RepID=A0A7H4LH90_WHEAT|nr:unnamed protein product [Triticum aestivum]
MLALVQERGVHGRSSPPDLPPLLCARRPLQLLAPPPSIPPLLFSSSLRSGAFARRGSRSGGLEEQGRARPGAPSAARARLVPCCIFSYLRSGASSYSRKQRAEGVITEVPEFGGGCYFRKEVGYNFHLFDAAGTN